MINTEENKMHVSIIVPAYNVNKYLSELIESLSQYDKNLFTLIIIDDAGQEYAEEVVSKYLETGMNIIFNRNEFNSGQGISRNIGINLIPKNTTNVIFIDGDDRFSNKFDFSILNSNKLQLFGYNILKKQSLKYRKQTSRNNLTSFGVNPYIWGCSIPVEIAKRIKFSTGKHEDIAVKAEIVANNENIVEIIDMPIIDYRVRRSSTVGRGIQDVQELKEHITEYNKIIENNWSYNIQKEKMMNQRNYEAYYWCNSKEKNVLKEMLLPISRQRKIAARLAMFFQKITFFKYWMRGFGQFD